MACGVLLTNLHRVGLYLNFELESAHEFFMDLNFGFSKSMNLNLNFDFSRSMNLNLNFVFLKSMNFNILIKHSMDLDFFDLKLTKQK